MAAFFPCSFLVVQMALQFLSLCCFIVPRFATNIHFDDGCQVLRVLGAVLFSEEKKQEMLVLWLDNQICCIVIQATQGIDLNVESFLHCGQV